MPASKFRADYDLLLQISTRFGREKQEAQKTLATLQSRMQPLKDGDWVGQGANAFFAEMEGEVLPALRRLVAALDAAERKTQQMKVEIQNTEAACAALFKANDDGIVISDAANANLGVSKVLFKPATSPTPPATPSDVGLPVMKNSVPAYVPTPSGAVLVKDDFSVNDVKQGFMNDCYLVASIAAIALQNPDQIKNMIKDNADGTYTVTFYESGLFGYSSKMVTVDSQLLNVSASSATGTELWVGVLEKAYAANKGSYEAINKGSPPGQVLQDFTGKTSETIAMKDIAIADLKKRLDEKQELIVSTFEAGSASFKNNLPYTDGTLQPNHAYYIISVDEKSSKVKLGNPHGPFKYVELDYADFQANFLDLQTNPLR